MVQCTSTPGQHFNETRCFMRRMPKALGLVFTTGPDGKPVQDRSINCVACNVGFECPEGTQQDTMAVSPGFWCVFQSLRR